MKTYFVDDELLPEYLKWEGTGYYCSQQRGSHENQHIVTVRCGDADSNLDEMAAYNFRNGWGTAGWLDAPYGVKR